VSLPPSTSEPSSSSEHARWFEEEVQPHEPALRAWLRARFPSLWDVDDLIQETYERLFRAKRAGKIAQARPYLFAVARNAAASIYRRRKIIAIESVAEIEDFGVAEDKADAAETASREQELSMLAEAISGLPKRCRQVLTLRKLHGLSHREIAQKLGISENTVNAQAALGVLRCRDYLESKGVIK